jgi:hypothetical protein
MQNSDDMVPGACDLERVYMIMGNVDPPRSLEKCGLHPLIHTLLEFNLPQDIVLSKIHRLFREWGLL